MNKPATVYADKDRSYFRSAREDIVRDLPIGIELRVLEIGCGSGETGALAKATGRVSRYVGLEVDPQSAEEARLVLDEVIEADLETLTLPFPPESFDVLIASEVLEHLFDPSAALKRISLLIKPGGLLYASSPNVAHHSVLRMLLGNRWDYMHSGRMDWTHIRWFTPATYRELIETAGFRIIWIRPIEEMTPKQRIANLLTFKRFGHLFMSQIFVKAQRTGNSP
jgi:SAM-dependent methyltransferase